jgi:GH24 family phage-related lysozyme (muramidase)
MGTWIKETQSAFYLMEGGYYIAKIAKYPSEKNPTEQVVNIAGMKAWFTRDDAPGGMTICGKDGIDPLPKPTAVTVPATPSDSSSNSPKGGGTVPPLDKGPGSSSAGPAAGSAAGSKRINSNGLLLIKSFEGLRLKAYRDAVGIWTIGYGTTRGVQPNMAISEAEAEKFLQQDLNRFEQAIQESVTVPLNDNQFSALVSFTYNVGSGALRSSTLLKMLNARSDLRSVADQLLRWNRAGGQVLEGLTRRRKAERALFLGEDFRKFL